MPGLNHGQRLLAFPWQKENSPRLSSGEEDEEEEDSDEAGKQEEEEEEGTRTSSRS